MINPPPLHCRAAEFQWSKRTIFLALFGLGILLGLVAESTLASTSPPSVKTASAPHQSKSPFSKQLQKALGEEISARGLTRVIVGLRMPDARQPTAATKQPSLRSQRKWMKEWQDEVVQRMARPSQVKKRFPMLNQMAMEVDRQGLQELFTSPDVSYAQQDTLLYPSLSSSSPLIGASAAWAQGSSGGGQIVAIIDTGVDSGHPFLAGKVISEACFSTTYSPFSSTSLCPGGASQLTGSGSGAPCSLPGCWHGTHVAGIAAGKGSTFSGVARDANILAIQVFSEFPGSALSAYTSDIINALDHVLSLSSSGINIAAVNMSLGGSTLFDSQLDCDSSNLATKAAIDRLRDAGIATVIAAGNNGSINGVSSPGCISSAIVVGSTTKDDSVSSFSNMSSYVPILAPGSSIRSSIPGGGFGSASGTSMATPQITGAFAVLREKRDSEIGAESSPGPRTVEQILAALIHTAVTLSDPNEIFETTRIQLDDATATFKAESAPPFVQVYDNDFSGTTTQGTFSTITPTLSYNGTALQSSSQSSATYRFSLGLPQVGVYDVQAWWPDHIVNPSPATYEVHHTGGSTIIAMDQRTREGKWNSLGQFDLDLASFVDITSSGDLIVDAIRLEFLSTTPQALEIENTALPQARIGAYYSARLKHKGGVSPYSWTVTPLLPDGLQIDAETGEISGFPTTSYSDFLAFQITDGKQTVISKFLQLDIKEPGIDTPWVDDSLPAGANPQTSGDAWTWVTNNPPPISGSVAHQSLITPGVHQHYFSDATETLTIATGETLYAHLYLDPTNPPSTIALQWNNGNWEHRAYWGANLLPWGTDGTASRQPMGPLPPAGQWVRLEVPASLFDLEGTIISGMSFTQVDGRATWDNAGVSSAASQPGFDITISGAVDDGSNSLQGVRFDITSGGSCADSNASGFYSCVVPSNWSGTIRPTLSGYGFAPTTHTYTGLTDDQPAQDFSAAINTDTVWLDDSVPEGTTQLVSNDSWTWVSADPTPYSGSSAHQSSQADGLHQHWFLGATLAIAAGDTLYSYVYLNPDNPPSTIALQWNDGTWDHRAYWGANLLPWGTDGSASRYPMGPLPPTGQWVRLEVPASLVDLEDTIVNGMAFTLVDGQATWDNSGVSSATSQSAPNITISGTVDDSSGTLAGVQFSATIGASCSSSNASGIYSCTVTDNWTGTVTPRLNGYSFTPPSLAYTDLSEDQTAENYAASTVADIPWVDDAVPTAATLSTSNDAWNWITTNPAPQSGSFAHQSTLADGLHQHWFADTTDTLPVGSGTTLYAYVYLDPANPPTTVALQWNDGNWDHRAYWGADLLPWGTNGTASRYPMGPLPTTGQWVRLEVPADLVGLEGAILNGMAFVQVNGQATWDNAGVSALPAQTGPDITISGTASDSSNVLAGVQFSSTGGVSCSNSDASGAYTCTAPFNWFGDITPILTGYRFSPSSLTYTNVTADQTSQDYAASATTDISWIDDAVPTGATQLTSNDVWAWVSTSPPPQSGSSAHQSSLADGIHQHYFIDATVNLTLSNADTLYAYVYLDPDNPPSTIALQWNDGSWDHRAYWGADLLPWGTNGTASRYPMGPLPVAGQWVRLEIPAGLVGLDSAAVSGMAFTLVNGRATWDDAGHAPLPD